jgi:hypothetical protein
MLARGEGMKRIVLHMTIALVMVLAISLAVATPVTAQLTDVVDPGDTGGGVIQPHARAPLPEGWTEKEYLFSGDAVRYEATGELGEDGMWEVAEAGSAPYRTRMIVRRPDAADFSGIVLVEWLNVSGGADASTDWAYLAEEIARAGHVWVGVSVQAVGVNDLVAQDPERYGDLEHPGDAYAFDIFTQAGVAVVDGYGVLSGLTPTHVIAIGQSQSAMFLTTYVNAVHPLMHVYDGFLIHSRAGVPADLSGGFFAGIVRMRTDLDEPVFLYATETDLILDLVAARQEDSATVHTWEVAGTAHADAYILAISSGLPRDPSLGSQLGCPNPINNGPQHETLLAALHHLVAWVVDGTTPPTSPRIEFGGGNVIARDELGIAIGGIRTPPVDVPTRVLSGDPAGGGGFCFLFGQTLPLSSSVLARLYGSEAAYLDALQASADATVAAGWLLPEDAETLVAEEAARAATLDFEGGEGCFIATAAYGSYLDSHVETLRNFRDSYMVNNPVGKALVSAYYEVSPPVAEFIDDHPTLKSIVRVGLLPAVAVSTVAVNTTSAEKMAIVGVLLLVSTLAVVLMRIKGVLSRF